MLRSILFFLVGHLALTPIVAQTTTQADSLLELELWAGFQRHQYSGYDSSAYFLDRYADFLQERERYETWYYVKTYKILTAERFDEIAIQRRELIQTQDSLDRWCQTKELSVCATSGWTLALYRGTLAYKIRNFPEAIQHFQTVLTLLGPTAGQDSIASQYLASCYRYLGAVYKRTHQYQAAIQYFLQSLQVETFQLRVRDQMSAYKHLGDIYEALGEPVKALGYYQQALNFYEKEYQRHPELNRNPLTSVCMAMAQLEMRSRSMEKIRPYLRRALSIQPDDDPLYHKALLSLAETELELGDPEVAAIHLQETLRWRQATYPAGDRVAEALHLRGRILLAQDSTSLALSSFQAAADQLQSGQGNGAVAPALLVEVLGDIAFLQYQVAIEQPENVTQKQRAREAHDEAINWLDRLRMESAFEEDLIALTSSGYRLYEQAIALEASLPADDQSLPRIWQLMERSHALSLRRANAQRQLLSNLTEEEQAQQYLLATSRQQAYQTYLEQEAAGEPGEIARNNWFAAEQEYQQWLRKHPVSVPATVSLQDIQQELDPAVAVVNYFLGENQTYRFTLWHDSMTLDQLGTSASWSGLIQGLQHNILVAHQPTIATSQRLPSVDPASLGHMLHQSLIGDLEDRLPKNVIIIPDGPLWHLPFDVLRPTPDPEDFWIYHRGHSLAYSASWWWENQHKKSGTTSHGILALAPQFPEVPSSNGFLATRGSLGPLYQNRAEAQMLADLYGARIYLNEQARLETFREEAPNYRVIHLSTHGLASDEDGRFSLLAFAAPDDSLVLARDTFPQVEALFAAELYNLVLNAELVVLSACETNVGKPLKGEGVQSLSQGFFHAGSKALVATMWQVDDNWTKELMAHFYQALDGGYPKDEALRMAKLKLLDEGLDPYYWSGVVLMGQTDPIGLTSRSWTKLLLGLLGLLILGGALWLGRKFIPIRKSKAAQRDIPE